MNINKPRKLWHILCVLAAAGTGCALAEPPTGWLTTKYYAARDAAIFKITREDSIAESGAKNSVDDQNNALRGLEQQLQQILGPLTLAGYPPLGTINLAALDPIDINFGNLDGLAYKSNDGTTHLIVTTDEILSHWLLENHDERSVPADFDAAVKSDNFYSYAYTPDAMVGDFGEIPLVVKPRGPTVFAMLAVRAQNYGSTKPTEIILSVHQNGLLYVFEQQLAVMVPAFPACSAMYRDTGTPADERAYDRALRECYAARIKLDPSYPAVTAEAQTLFDLLLPVRPRSGAARSR